MLTGILLCQVSSRHAVNHAALPALPPFPHFLASLNRHLDDRLLLTKHCLQMIILLACLPIGQTFRYMATPYPLPTSIADLTTHHTASGYIPDEHCGGLRSFE
ncbi:unnamed protein product [Chrysoparadoxa australica]